FSVFTTGTLAAVALAWGLGAATTNAAAATIESRRKLIRVSSQCSASSALQLTNERVERSPTGDERRYNQFRPFFQALITLLRRALNASLFDRDSQPGTDFRRYLPSQRLLHGDRRLALLRRRTI